ESVAVRGRGGTVLQPGIDLIENAADFPKDGPILIVTDTYFDRVHVQRPHVFVIPKDGALPFVPHGPVFRIS
ncbi:MAG: peptidase, partial [Chloroflexi bacterium]|nr:peptidase [Chloroflexota bacterium]